MDKKLSFKLSVIINLHAEDFKGESVAWQVGVSKLLFLHLSYLFFATLGELVVEQSRSPTKK